MIALVLTCLVIGSAISHEMSSIQVDGATFLQEAANHLANYTAIQATKTLDIIAIGKKVADIGYKKLNIKIASDFPRHCGDYLSTNRHTESGIMPIKPDEGKPFYVYCEMNRNGGGWTKILYRYSSKIRFHRNWIAYKNGFGYLSGEGWLGLDKIHRLTKYNYAELLIFLRDRKGNYYYPQYGYFRIGDEASHYKLYIGNFTGDGGDSLSYSDKAKFSTYDRDNDYSSGNCASSHHGGWWYNNCARGKLTGDPYTSSTSNYYVKWPTVDSYAILYAYMYIRPLDNSPVVYN